jgi:hypothetical protein
MKEENVGGRNRFLRRGFCCCAVVLFWLLAASAEGAEAKRFDCGTAKSAVMGGYERLTAEDSYSVDKGYGWESPGARSVEFENPGPLNVNWRLREKTFSDNLTDLNRDGVVSEDELVFRADVPDGTYRVTVTIGDMSKSIGSMDVYINGELAGAHVAAWTPGQYRRPLAYPYGWWAYVRATVDVKDGYVRIKLSKNQSYYDEQMAEQMTWENPLAAWYPQQAGTKNPPYDYIGWPFVHNSVMGIDIVPHVPAPAAGEDDKLRLTRKTESPGLSRAIELFNKEDFAGALDALGDVREAGAQAARAIVGLWLAGRLEVEKDRELVPQAIKALRKFVSSHPEENEVAEILLDAETFQKALKLFLERGALGTNGYIEIDKAIGWWWLIEEGTPLYYKTQLYIARSGHMLTPYVPTLDIPEQSLRMLEKKFPDNRHVRYLLHWEWDQYGDGTHGEDWYLPDYDLKVEDAPDWARAIYPAFNSLVDWAEWFIKFRQGPEGAIGGGLSDDVEMVGVFGYLGFTGRGVSDISIEGARKLCESNWKYGDIDDEIGFYLPFADAEHVAEPTGNTLGMMVTIDYGNPLWLERSMKTGKLLRDLWTGHNDRGVRHFRANFFNAARVGTGERANDSWINYRAVSPASAVLWYNNNPAISKVFVELGEGWRTGAMSTERGKPEGVIPAQVSFPQGIIGGTSSPNWYTASHPKGTVNYDWADQRYKDLMQNVLITAYEQTKDAKFLEPLKLEYELAAKYGHAPQVAKKKRLGPLWRRGSFATELVYQRWPELLEEPKQEEKGESVKKAAPKPAVEVDDSPAEEGSERWVAQKLQGVGAWPRAKQIMEGRKGELEADLTKDDIIRHGGYVSGMLQVRWPLMTTEAHATDRAAFVGVLNPFLIYTGAGASGRFMQPSITYDNTTRDFAAAVMATDAQGFRIMYYSLTPDTREIGLIPWDLEAGGKYAVTYGPDLDGDEKMDSVTERKEFVYRQRGTPVNITVEPRITYLIEGEQLERGSGFSLMADPGISSDDIRYTQMRHTGILMARIHNVGSKAAQNVEVEFYDGDPDAGGSLIGTGIVYDLQPPNDLEPRPVTVGVEWSPTKEAHEIYVVVDPKDEIKDEITTFNNKAHTTLPKKDAGEEVKKKLPESAFSSGGRR